MPMKLKAQLMDDVTVKRALTRLSYEIIEKSRDLENVVLIGIKTRGVPLAEQIAANIETHTGVKVQTCTLDITFYRDDLTKRHDLPTVNTQTLPVDLNDKEVILVDDVLFTGRTVRAAIDAVFRFGRPARIRLVVLVDRGHTASCPFALILWARISPPLYARSSPCIWKLWTARRTWKSTSRTRTNRKSTGNDPLLVQKSN